MALKDWIPERIRKRPLVSFGVFIAGVVVIGILGIYMLEKGCAVLSAQWCQDQLGGIIEGETKP
ncbi:MAG: hypothetical protein O7H40_03105 [Gammaproteobacteria bacterium]|nr:hypothetical protein [Gammaproteobacteria bacterium]